jgi:hypothetical protein
VDPFGTPADVEERWGRPLTAEQVTLVVSLLAAASRMIRAQLADVDARIADGWLDPALVVDVAVEMVLRVLRNPSGLTQQSAGPYEGRYDDRVAAGFLYLKDDEAALLSGRHGRPRVGSVRLRLWP